MVITIAGSGVNHNLQSVTPANIV